MDRHSDWANKLEWQLMEALATSITDAFGADARVRVYSGHDIHLVMEDFSATPDGIVELEALSKRLRIFVEVIGSGYPRDIRDAVWRLDALTNHRSASYDLVRMIAAESLSPGAKKELKERGIAFFELGGSLFLKHESWLINIQKPSKPSASKRAMQLFTGARESVIHALLVHNHEWLTGIELSELAETSQYTCSLVLQELTLREWSESVGGGPTKRRRLVEPGALLDAWAAQWHRRNEESTKWYTFVEDPKFLLTQLTERIARQHIDFPWAFTGTAAANIFAPLLTSTDNAEIIVPTGYADQMAKALNLKPATKGANVTLIERDGASLLFRDRYSEYPAFFASPYILYLDLLNGRGRNKELAEHIRDKLESRWARN